MRSLNTSDGIDDSYLELLGINVKDLMFAVTFLCNCRCKHCYVGSEWLNSATSFSREEAIRIVDHFARDGLERLTFLGGEPLLYPYITDLVVLTRDYDIKEKRIATNGLDTGFLDLDRIKPNDLDHISFSFEGHIPELHEYIRGDGTFEKTLTTMEKLL